jgi:hypothetical protein
LVNACFSGYFALFSGKMDGLFHSFSGKSFRKQCQSGIKQDHCPAQPGSSGLQRYAAVHGM